MSFHPPSARLRSLEQHARNQMEKHAESQLEVPQEVSTPVDDHLSPATLDPKMRKADLLALAQQLGVPVADNATKSEIIAALEAAR